MTCCPMCGLDVRRRYLGGDPENGPATQDCLRGCRLRVEDSRLLRTVWSTKWRYIARRVARRRAANRPTHNGRFWA
jgi:hypothetical protein